MVTIAVLNSRFRGRHEDQLVHQQRWLKVLNRSNSNQRYRIDTARRRSD